MDQPGDTATVRGRFRWRIHHIFDLHISVDPLGPERSDGARGALCSCQRDARLDCGLRRFRAGKLDVTGAPAACMDEPAPRPLAWSENSQQLAQRLFTKSIDRVPLGADDRDAAIANSCMLGARVGVGREVTLDKPDAVARKKIFCAPARLASVTGEDFDIHLAYPSLVSSCGRFPDSDPRHRIQNFPVPS